MIGFHVYFSFFWDNWYFKFKCSLSRGPWPLDICRRRITPQSYFMRYATCVGWYHLWTENAASPWKFLGGGQSSFVGKQYTQFWSLDTRLAICKYQASSVQQRYQNIRRPPAGRPHSVWTYMRLWHQSFIKWSPRPFMQEERWPPVSPSCGQW